MENIPTIRLVVAAAICDGNGRWLMQKRALDKHHGGLWEFPGGKVERDETPEIALIREIREELGIVIDRGEPMPCCFAEERAEQAVTPIVILLYIVRRWTGEPVALDGEEVAWFTPEEVVGLDLAPLDVELSAKLLGEQAG